MAKVSVFALSDSSQSWQLWIKCLQFLFWDELLFCMSVWSSLIPFYSFGQVMCCLQLQCEGFVRFCKNILIICDKHMCLSNPVFEGATKWSRASPRHFSEVMGGLLLLLLHILIDWMPTVPIAKLCIWFWSVSCVHLNDLFIFFVIAIIALFMFGSWPF